MHSDHLPGNACFSADFERSVRRVCAVDVRRRNVSKKHACKPSPPATKVKHVAPRTNPVTVFLPLVGHQFVETPCLTDRVLVGLANKGALDLGDGKLGMGISSVPGQTKRLYATRGQSIADSCGNSTLNEPAHISSW